MKFLLCFVKRARSHPGKKEKEAYVPLVMRGRMPPGIPYPVKGFAPREKKANGSRRLRFGVPGLQPGFPASCGKFVFIIDNRSAFCQAAPRQPEKNGRRGAVNCISTVSPSGLRLRDVRDRRREGRAFYEKLSAVEPQLEGKPFFVSHKSCCVNLSLVRRIDPELRCFEMADGSNVPIRRESMSRAKRAYEDFLFFRARNGV